MMMQPPHKSRVALFIRFPLAVAMWFGCAVAASAETSLNGVWEREDGTLVDFVQDGSRVSGRMRYLLNDAEFVLGWKKGDLLFEAELSGSTLLGERRYLFPLAMMEKCPATRGDSGRFEMEILDDDTITARWSNGLLQPDCTITPAGWFVEVYRRTIPTNSPAPDEDIADPSETYETPGAGAPANAGALTEENLLAVCPRCLDSAVRYLALKGAYPAIKQYWLDLVAEFNALGGADGLSRMRFELIELEEALTPPPPPEFSTIESIGRMIRAGWRRHAQAFDVAFSGKTDDIGSFFAWLAGYDIQGWYTQRQYVPSVGERLSKDEIEILWQEYRARENLLRRQRARRDYLIDRIALAETYPPRIERAGKAVDEAEREILAQQASLDNCLAGCAR